MSGQLSREDMRDVFNSRFSYSDIGVSDIMALEGFLGIELARYRETTDYGRDCGWADSENTAPFLRSFSRWMDEWLSEKGALIE